MKGAKVRRAVRKMWAAENPANHRNAWDVDHYRDFLKWTPHFPVYIVPATPEDMELLVDKVAQVMRDTWELHPEAKARAALSAVFGKGSR